MNNGEICFRYTVPRLPTGRAVTLEEIERILLERMESGEGEKENTLWDLTVVYSRTGRHEKAIECLEQLLHDCDDDPERRAHCYLALGQTMEQTRDYAAACQYYRRALLHEPRNTEAWYLIHNNLGFSLSQLGAHEEALPFLRHAVKISPHRPNAYKNIGMACEGLGRYAEATGCYVTATQVDASDGRSAGLLEALLDAHPELIEDDPELDRRMEACREAVRIAAESHPDFPGHWAAMRRQQQRKDR